MKKLIFLSFSSTFSQASRLLAFNTTQHTHERNSEETQRAFQEITKQLDFSEITKQPAFMEITKHCSLETNKKRDVSTGLLAHLFAHSLAPLTHSLAPYCWHRSRPPLSSLACLLTSLTPSLMGQ